MSDLKTIEKLKIEKLFGMGSGCVLDFSNGTFQNLILDNSGIDLYEDENCTDSKANRLRSFWKEESNYIVGNLLKELLEYYRVTNQEAEQTEQNLWNECLKIAERLVQNNSVHNLETSIIKKIDHSFIQEHIEKCDKKIIEEDFSGAITNARSLVETILLHIKAELFQKEEKFNGDLNSLYKEISKKLNLSIDKNKKIENSLKKIISGLFSIVSGIAELGNDLGDRHGKATKKYITGKHHAILVVNSAKTFTEFIFSSYEKQKENGKIKISNNDKIIQQNNKE